MPGKPVEHHPLCFRNDPNIAEKTNQLALNAAIGAARASEHGLRFAVVAHAPTHGELDQAQPHNDADLF